MTLLSAAFNNQLHDHLCKPDRPNLDPPSHAPTNVFSSLTVPHQASNLRFSYGDLCPTTPPMMIQDEIHRHLLPCGDLAETRTYAKSTRKRRMVFKEKATCRVAFTYDEHLRNTQQSQEYAVCSLDEAGERQGSNFSVTS